MLTLFIFSVIYCILSTILIHPWYIKGILKGKTLFKHYEYYNLERYERDILYILTFLILSIIQLSFWYGISMGIHLMYPQFIPKEYIFLIAMLQFFNILGIITTKLRHSTNFKIYFTVLIVFTFIAIFTTKDNTVKNIEIPEFETYCKDEINVSYILPNCEIPAVGRATLYTENNTKYIILNNKESKIIIIDLDSNKVKEEITINSTLSLNLLLLREKFPYQLLKEQNFAIIDNKVFEIISVIDAKPFSTEAKFSGFLLVDLESGNIITI